MTRNRPGKRERDEQKRKEQPPEREKLTIPPK